jgi:hypothetical protein
VLIAINPDAQPGRVEQWQKAVDSAADFGAGRRRLRREVAAVLPHVRGSEVAAVAREAGRRVARDERGRGGN